MIGPMARQAIGDAVLAEVEDLFAELMHSASHPVRVIPRGRQMRELVSRHAKYAKPLLTACACLDFSRGYYQKSKRLGLAFPAHRPTYAHALERAIRHALFCVSSEMAGKGSKSL